LDLACLLIADDLTGACDAAVQFALRGFRVTLSLNSACEAGQTGPTDVLAVSTESRDGDLGSFRNSLERLTPLRPRILFKKIDSTLRGNVGPEVAAAMAAFGCDVAVVAPAFPAMGRTVEAGYLRVAGEIGFVPRELAASFRDLPGRFALRDAACDAHLDAIAADGLAGGERVLWVGSAGLAAALARALGMGSPAGIAFSPAPAIFCLGSDHAVTLQQQEHLVRDRAARLFAAETASDEAIPEALERGRHVVLRIRRGHTSAARVRQLLARARYPLVLCGGDTASLVCRALEVQAIDLRREVARGIPYGVIGGGLFDALPVVTKSGGFGRPDALIDVADFFTCSPLSH